MVLNKSDRVPVRTSLDLEAWMGVERDNAVTRAENVRMSKEQFRRETERIQKTRKMMNRNSEGKFTEE